MTEMLPLFPLSMVLFPGCRVPLHIFEERYRLMIGECVENGTEFGLVMGSDDDFAEIGCAARVADVVNRFADGRMNVIVEGTDRIRISDRQDDQPYITGTVERIPDEESEPADDLVEATHELYVEALKLSVGWYRAPSTQDQPFGAMSYAIGSSLGLPPDIQQKLLEDTSIPGRFEQLREALENVLGGLRDHARKTSGNGKVH